MNFLKLILENKFDEAKQVIFESLNSIAENRLKEAKEYAALELNEYVSNSNIQRMGRMYNIKKRIRRDKQGKMFVQRNIKRSVNKNYRVYGNTVRRITAIQKMRRSQQLKRSWKSSRRAKLNRSLIKRKMSMRRRQSLGIR